MDRIVDFVKITSIVRKKESLKMNPFKDDEKASSS